MDEDTVKDELLSLERKYWQAVKDKDVDTAMQLTEEPCIIAGASGIGSIDREKFVSIMKSAPYALKNFELKADAEASLLTDDVAILAYEVQEDLIVDGQPITINAAESSTWVRRDGHWLCAMHTESILGDPYGRDRQKIH